MVKWWTNRDLEGDVKITQIIYACIVVCSSISWGGDSYYSYTSVPTYVDTQWSNTSVSSMWTNTFTPQMTTSERLTMPGIETVYLHPSRSRQTSGTKKISSRPPSLLPLSKNEFDNLVTMARANVGDKMHELLKRDYWGMLKNPMTCTEISENELIKKNADSSRGHYYWHALINCGAISVNSILYKKIKNFAVKGRSTALYAYGLLKFNDRRFPHVRGNRTAALKWWTKADEKNFSPAQVALGLCAVEGTCLPENKKEAAEYFQKAAAQHHALGQFYLAKRYWFGNGVEEDKGRASHLLFQSHQKEAYELLNKKFWRTKFETDYLLWNEDGARQEVVRSLENLANYSTITTEMFGVTDIKLNSQIKELLTIYQTWIEQFNQSFFALGDVREGFMISVLGYRKNKFDDVMNNITLNGKTYVTIGEKNTTVFNGLRKLWNLDEKLEQAFSEIDERVKEKLGKYEKKINSHYVKQNAYSQMTTLVSPEQASLIPQEINRHGLKVSLCQCLCANISNLPTFMDKWNADVKAAQAALQNLITAGDNQRDARFVEVHELLNEKEDSVF